MRPLIHASVGAGAVQSVEWGILTNADLEGVMSISAAARCFQTLWS